MANKQLNLALQGGGSHGAFTWGVLDRLLEQKDLQIIGVSGTSAGAVNAACLTYGLIKGGNEGARAVLSEFWKKNSDSQRLSLIQPSYIDKMFSKGNIDHNPFFKAFTLMTMSCSPYEWNPNHLNPLRDLLLNVIDFDAIQNDQAHKIFLTATNIRTSKVKIFDNPEVSADSVCASACLPQFFQAVEIGGELYWDGGYIGNPAMFPLFQNTHCKDLMLIQVDSINWTIAPTRIADIVNRATDISFNSSLMREMRAINFVSQIIDKGFDDNGSLVRTNIHYISPGDMLNPFNSSSKLNVSWDWLTFLRDAGRAQADAWIEANYQTIGVKSSCDIDSLFM